MATKTATRKSTPSDSNGKTKTKTTHEFANWPEQDRQLTERLRAQRVLRRDRGPWHRVPLHDAAVTALSDWIIFDERCTAAQTALTRAIDALPQTRAKNEALLTLAFTAIGAERTAICEAWLDSHGFAALDAAFGRQLTR